MAGNKPVSFNTLSEQAAELKSHSVPIRLRRNTDAYATEDGNFEVFYYSSRIVTVYSDGSVRLNCRGYKTVSTKNRMNDLLIPLGWKITSVHGQWKVTTTHPPYRAMEFFDDIRIASINDDKDN